MRGAKRYNRIESCYVHFWDFQELRVVTPGIWDCITEFTSCVIKENCNSIFVNEVGHQRGCPSVCWVKHQYPDGAIGGWRLIEKPCVRVRFMRGEFDSRWWIQIPPFGPSRAVMRNCNARMNHSQILPNSWTLKITNQRNGEWGSHLEGTLVVGRWQWVDSHWSSIIPL